MLTRLTTTRTATTLRAAFTLIELLVVLSIIALLVAILLPTLKHAREKARIVICGTQLHQWGIVYTSYAGDFKDFWGGVPVWELRDCFSNTNQNYAPDNVPPWNGTYYEESPFNKSTVELGRRGLDHKWVSTNPVNSKGLTRCPSRIASGYGVTVGDGWGAGGITSPGSLIYVDYFVFAGFSNRNDDPPGMGWTAWGQPMSYGFWTFPPTPSVANNTMRYPPTHMRQRMSLRNIMVMDRHWTKGAPGFGGTKYYWYNDIGNLSNHVTFENNNTIVGSPNGAIIPLASGSNCLLLDMSVTFTAYAMANPTSPTQGNLKLGGDFYRDFFVGPNLRRP